MATTPVRPTSDADTDPRVLHPLRKLRGMIRSYVSIEGALTVLLFLTVWFWVGLFLDYGVFKITTFDWVQEAPREVRTVILIVVLSGLLTLVAFKIVRRLLRDFSSRSLALVLERRFPKLLGDRLITAVELADVKQQEKYGYSGEMIKKTIADAKERVDQVHVNDVFNWTRLRTHGFVLLGLTLGVFILTWAVLSAAFQVRLKTYVTGFGDVSSIWFERNILLQNTTWPRKAYLELVEFPASGELRVGRDRQPPKLRVQAFKWVWADSKTAEGWRPLTWADLPKALPGENIPPLPVETLERAQLESDMTARVAGWVSAFPYVPSSDAAAPAFVLPPDLAATLHDAAHWKVDRVEALMKENLAARSLLDEKLGAEAVLRYEQLFEKLEARAAEPSMSRTMRMLIVPSEVRLSYRGVKTSVDMALRQESGNEYVGSLSDLKESVDFRVRGEDYVTARNRITLVPAPAIIDLKRTEHRPAYLYHRPVLEPDRKPIPYAPEQLKGLRQVVADLPISLTGERSRFEMPHFTDVNLSATVDKDLQKAWIAVAPPGGRAEPNASDLARAELQVASDRRTVNFNFTAEAGSRIESSTEFALEFLDTDGVTSRRIVQAVPTEDRGPEVEVQVEVIRKVGVNYLCTPKALIPFAKESRVTDRNGGINKIEYVLSYTQLESYADVSSKAAIISLFFHNTPQMPSFAQGFYRAGMVAAFGPAIRSGKATVEQNVLLESFGRDYIDRKFITKELLLPKLKQPPPSADENPMITSFEFGPSGERGFDIEAVLPGLFEKDANKPQPHYLLTLNVSATDTNVESGPKTSLNKEPFTFRIVSEAELLAEISREESELGSKLDEVLRRLNDSDNKLSGVLTRIPSLSARDDFLPEQTRSAEILESCAKAKDITTDVATAYSRILEEYRTNRFNRDQTSRLAEKIVTPLDSVLKNEFPRWDEAHSALNSRLNQGMVPEPEVMVSVRQRMAELLARMRQIRAEIGEVLGFNKILVQAQEILKGLTQQIGPGIANQVRIGEAILFAPALRVPPLVSLTQAQKATLNVEIDWLVPLDEAYSWQILVPPESGIKVPARIEIKGTPPKMAFEITGGARTGEWDLQIIPSVGRRSVVKVSVK